MKPEFATDVPVVDIKRELAKANAFFHIMLRMIRLQYEKDHPASQSLFDSFTDKPVSAEELFARTELKLNDVLREPSPPACAGMPELLTNSKRALYGSPF